VLGLSSMLQDELFYGYKNLARVVGSSDLKRHGVKFIVYEICDTFLNVPFNAESFRNHAISKWLDAGLSTQKVCDLAGYSSPGSLVRFQAERASVRSKIGSKHNAQKPGANVGVEK
jgi:integrase/recombinase XerD